MSLPKPSASESWNNKPLRMYNAFGLRQSPQDGCSARIYRIPKLSCRVYTEDVHSSTGFDKCVKETGAYSVLSHKTKTAEVDFPPFERLPTELTTNVNISQHVSTNHLKRCLIPTFNLKSEADISGSWRIYSRWE